MKQVVSKPKDNYQQGSNTVISIGVIPFEHRLYQIPLIVLSES
jgi:hypothetical protein